MGFLQRRIVWPGILSLIGAYSPFFIGAVFLQYLNAGGLGPVIATSFGGVALSAGAVLFAFSFLLLFDIDRHRIWGLLLAASYAIALIPLYYTSIALTNPTWGLSIQFAAWAAAIAPIIGLVGGVWGFFWKPASVVTPETILAKPGQPPWSPSDKPILPGLLSMAGIALPFFYLVTFLAFFVLPQPPTPQGGEGPSIGFLLIPGLLGVAVFLVIIPLMFSAFLLFQPRSHRTWGTVLAIWWGLVATFLWASYLINSISSLASPVSGPSSSPGFDPLSTVLYLAPFLGVAGGVWGIFWHTGVSPRNWTPQRIAWSLRGPAGMLMFGAIAGIVCAIYSSGVLAIFPFLLFVGSWTLRKGGVRNRTHAGFLLGTAAASILLLLSFQWIGYWNGSWELSQRVAGVVGLVAAIFAAFGVVKSIGVPLIPRWKRLTPGLLLVLLVGAIGAAGTGYAYLTVLANKPVPPNMTITNVNGTYTQDCGPSGTQTTMFNMTWTVVNTGGHGIATFGLQVNGQLAWTAPYGYGIGAYSQQPIWWRITVHACYGAMVPTYTVVLLSQSAV